MRTLRKVIDISLPFAGVAVILGAVLFMRADLTMQIAVVGFGMVLIEVGIWKGAHRLLPSERKYPALRTEGHLFMKLLRRLNAVALALRENDSPERRQAFEEVQDAMRQAVERMAHVAGKTDAELASERKVSASA
ncbi:MAG: hypothetical protein ACE5H7_00840 [Acidiferrobacterales bacterium]